MGLCVRLILTLLLFSGSRPFLTIKKMVSFLHNTYIPLQENCSCDGNCDLQEIGENTIILKGKGIYYVKIPHLQHLSYEW